MAKDGSGVLEADARDRVGIEGLVAHALALGATAAVVIPADRIRVDPRLAEVCREPRCPYYGLCSRCPPHHDGPEGFKRLLERFDRALFFRIDVPRESLFSSDRRELFQLLHEVAAGVELRAVKTGFPEARGYAGGSCKEIFCDDRPDCRVLVGRGGCRHPCSARPSMSGFGIDVAGLVEAAGWKGLPAEDPSLPEAAPMSSLYGLVLVD